MIEKNLYNAVLIEPALIHKADRLNIVSGFATASLADRHCENLKQYNCDTRVDLVIGMARREGIPLAHHNGFCSLTQIYNGKFYCSYATNIKPIHSKLYVWTRHNTPVCAWIGSANYTITGFGNGQKEILTEVNKNTALDYFYKTKEDSINCDDENVGHSIRLYKQEINENNQLEQATLPLTSRRLGGQVQNKAGLNWGQRPKRNPDQAYIPVPSHIAQSNFFPPKGQQFTVLTDDEQHFICVVAQDNNKGIETTLDNSILGRYFRKRISVDSGQFITRLDLENYGRLDVTFYKIDDETYHMDFSPERDI